MDNSVYDNIAKQLEIQLSSFFADTSISVVEENIDKAYERCMVAIGAIIDKYLKRNGMPYFNLYHSGCWSVFLYYLSNTLAVSGERDAADKIYYLNKILHGVDWHSEIQLPKHFMVEHPLGSVLGRATYGDYLFIYQGVTIGGNISLESGQLAYPVLGKNVLFYSNAKCIGNAHVGNNVIFSANSCVINEDIPENSIVFGTTPNLIIKHDADKIRKCMMEIWEYGAKNK